MESLIELAKSLSRGPCGCQYNMGSFSVGYDYVSGQTAYKSDRGPRTHHCTRCKAREALEADGIEYEKDDRVMWTHINMGIKLDPATACKTIEGQVFTTTGSLGPVGAV